MTKKDYIVIAGVLNKVFKNMSEYDMRPSLRAYIVDEFCYQLEAENPRFDAVRFKRAINGVPENGHEKA